MVLLKRVLVVEDEAAIREFIVINLNRAGYETVEADSGEKALSVFSEENGAFSIALLDIMLPGIDGLAVCKELRESSSTLGIIMLTARTQDLDKVSGLMLGADDYVTKPFSPSELVARVDSLYRRVEMLQGRGELKSNGEEIILGEFTLNLRRRTLTKSGKNIVITQIEFQLLEYFFMNPDVALSRNDILTTVWGDAYFTEEKIVDVNIRRLRMKIENEPSLPEHLLTVWGMGYKWSTEVRNNQEEV